MTYGALKDYVLQLMNQYSVAGTRIPMTYNEQADLAARIPALTRDGLQYVATTARRLRTVAELGAPAEQGGVLLYDLPDDFYQMAAGLLRLEGGQYVRYQGYRLLGGRQVAVPKQDRGAFQVEYFRYPHIPQGTRGMRRSWTARPRSGRSSPSMWPLIWPSRTTASSMPAFTTNLSAGWPGWRRVPPPRWAWLPMPTTGKEESSRGQFQYPGRLGLPDPPEERMLTFENLSGGLNLFELDYRMDSSQSPEMENLWWRDGLLSCRDGQEAVTEALGTGICCAERLFWGQAVLHIGDGLYAGHPGETMTLTKLCGGLPEIRGTFIRYRDALLYKTKGAFKTIQWEDGALTAADVTPYVPVIAVNCSPADGAGDLYQPENRLSPQKTLWYTAARESRGVAFSANGTAKEFRFETEDGEPVAAVEQVYIGTTLVPETEYTVSLGAQNSITFLKAPENARPSAPSIPWASGSTTCPDRCRRHHFGDRGRDRDHRLHRRPGGGDHHLRHRAAGPGPAGQQYRGDHLRKGQPRRQKKHYGLPLWLRLRRHRGAVLILAGSEAQPNAYFWNGSHIAMDPGYFPMEYYNLAGDSLEPVTGFGLQAGYLMVFKSHAVGRCLLGAETIGDRAYLTLDYTPVNAAIGCDLPFTIRLVENNLVWCSTYGGVYRLEDTTAALENQVRCISGNVNGCAGRPGLLEAVKTAGSVCALDDGERYWVAAGGQVYLWDYRLSTAGKPSWFYFTNIPAVSFFRGDSLDDDGGQAFTGPLRIYHLDAEGRVSRFVRSFRDYGQGIPKVFRFPTQDFGGHLTCKTVRRVILSTRSDTDTVLDLTYETDYGSRRDLTPVECYAWRLAPRDLRRRMLAVRQFAHVAVRKPGCRHIRHFTMRLTNDVAGCDMSLVSAQIVFTVQRRNR